MGLGGREVVNSNSASILKVELKDNLMMAKQELSGNDMEKLEIDGKAYAEADGNQIGPTNCQARKL